MSQFQTFESCMEDLKEFFEESGDGTEMWVNRPDHLHLQPMSLRPGSTSDDGRLLTMTERVRQNLNGAYREMPISENNYSMNPPVYYGGEVVDRIDELNEMLRAGMQRKHEEDAMEVQIGENSNAEEEGEAKEVVPDRDISSTNDNSKVSRQALKFPQRNTSKCQQCSRVGESLSMWHQAHRRKSFEPQIPPKAHLQWSTSLMGLMVGTNERCCFCSFICDQFFGPGGWAAAWLYEPKKEWYADPEEERIRNKLLVRCMSIYESYGEDIDLLFSIIPRSVSEDDPSDIDRLEIGLASDTTKDWERLNKFVHSIVVKLSVYAAHDSATAGLVSTRPPNATPTSRRGLDQLRQWLKECDCHHQDTCKNTLDQMENKLPSRVLDVQGGDWLRLHETIEAERGNYVALSYCWGGPQEFQTTTDTLTDRVAGFDVSVLPQTLRDAVHVVQELGLRYLWVDSLCIIQDDESDKLHEVSKMGDIYQFAYLTISAARADKVTQGFLHDTKDPDTGLWKNLFPLSMPIPNHNANSPDELWDEDAQDGTLWLSNEVIALKQGFPDPVSRRAWCLQERVLSARTIVYGRWPIWICNKTAHGDGGPNDLSSQFYASEADRTLSCFISRLQLEKLQHHSGLATEPRLGKADRTLDRMISKVRSQHQAKRVAEGTPAKMEIVNKAMTDSERALLLHSWYDILSDFTKREMSLESDRLRAVGGIASEISKLTGDIYVAGLWISHILPGLMWSSRSREWNCRPTSGWRAPTWSWASINGPVSMPSFIFSPDSSTRQEAQCLEMRVPNDKMDSLFGKIDQGCELHMTGKISEISDAQATEIYESQSMAPSPPTKHFSDWAVKQLADAKERLRKTRNSDALGSPLPGPVHALIMFSHRLAKIVPQGLAEVYCYSGLLLSQTSDDKFERIGTFNCLEREWLNGCLDSWEQKMVVLV